MKRGGIPDLFFAVWAHLVDHRVITGDLRKHFFENPFESTFRVIRGHIDEKNFWSEINRNRNWALKLMTDLKRWKALMNFTVLIFS